MRITILITGLLLIGVGFLVKRFPNLIAGYNTMSKQRKEQVDVQGLSTFMRNGLIIMGVLIILGYYLFTWIGWDTIANLVLTVVVFPGCIVLVIKAQKFDKNEKKMTSKWIYFSLILLFLLVLGVLIYGLLPTKAMIEKDTIRFTGQYGIELNRNEIESIELLDNIPPIKTKTNGFNFGNVNKGTFKLDSFGKCYLLLNSNNGPYLFIKKQDGSVIIVNNKKNGVTEDVY